MRRVFLKRLNKKWGLICAAGLVFLLVGINIAPRVILNSRSPEYRNTGFEIQRDRRKFSGVLYDWHKSFRPRHFALVWRGRIVGTEWFWYENGSVAAIQPYRFGRSHGEWRQWYPDGKVKSLRRYVNGKLDGESWAWHDNGVVSDFRFYRAGREVVYKSFISDGKPFYNYVQHDGQRIGVQGGSFCKTIPKRDSPFSL